MSEIGCRTLILNNNNLLLGGSITKSGLHRGAFDKEGGSGGVLKCHKNHKTTNWLFCNPIPDSIK